MPPDPDEFRTAMARLSSHVTIVTARDRTGSPRGFTASAVCSLSLTPPLLLVCIARSACSHDTFVAAQHFAVNVLRHSHRELAVRFATPCDDRFAGTGFECDEPAPYLPDALSVLTCSVHAVHPGGDHTILIGHVDSVATSAGAPLVYFEREFRGLDCLDHLDLSLTG